MFSNLENRIINAKNPLLQTISNHVLYYPTPVNFSYAYSFGSLVGIFFAIQILTGVFLAMHYTAHTDLAFASVVHIMTDDQKWIFSSLYACKRSFHGLYFNLYSYWSGFIFPFLYSKSTTFMMIRNNYIFVNDGYRLYWLRFTLRTNEFLRSNCNYKSGYCSSFCRRKYCLLSLRWLFR